MTDPAPQAVLEATGLGKRYRRTWALRDCTLALPRGRIAALVGPNGAGKTTLLHLAVGLLAPTAGTIRVLGRAPGEDPGLLARVGFVAQDAPLYGDFTGAELLGSGLGSTAASTRRWPATGWGASASPSTGGSTGCRAASGPRSPWPWPWPSGPSCCCWTSRWPASTRWPGASSSRS
jgi:ABC transporter